MNLSNRSPWTPFKQKIVRLWSYDVGSDIPFGYWGNLAWEIGMICSSSNVKKMILKPLLRPFVIVLSYLELHGHNRKGNGLLLLARKIAL